jgi:hypothetical protein
LSRSKGDAAEHDPNTDRLRSDVIAPLWNQLIVTTLKITQTKPGAAPEFLGRTLKVRVRPRPTTSLDALAEGQSMTARYLHDEVPKSPRMVSQVCHYFSASGFNLSV